MVWLRMAVFNPPLCVLSLGFQIAVLDPVAHLLRRSGSRIRADIGLTANLPAQTDVFVRPEGIRVFHTPGLVEKRLPLCSHRILPMIG